MVQINFAQKTVSVKIVYYGPGMSGKTTNLEIVHQRAPDSNRGDLTSIATDGDRTLFFDFMPLDLGTVAGMRTQFQIYTVPGQVYYNSTRKLVLQGVDGVIFVADSSASMLQENFDSLRNLQENLAEYGKDISSVPYVIQYNKRDLPDAMTVDELEQQMNPHGVPCFEAVANTGQGVFPTLKALAAIVLDSIHKNQGGGSVQGGAPGEAAAPAMPEAPAMSEAPAMPEVPAPAAMPAPAAELPPAASAPPAPLPTPEAAPEAPQPVFQAAPQQAAASAQESAPPQMATPQMATGFHPQSQVPPQPAPPQPMPPQQAAPQTQMQMPPQGQQPPQAAPPQANLQLAPRQQPAQGGQPQQGYAPQQPAGAPPMSATSFHQQQPAPQQQAQQQPQQHYQPQQAPAASLESTNLRMRPQMNPDMGQGAPHAAAPAHTAPAPASRAVPSPRQASGQGGRLKPRSQARPTPKNSARKRSAVMTIVFVVVALGAGVALGGTVFNLF